MTALQKLKITQGTVYGGKTVKKNENCNGHMIIPKLLNSFQKPKKIIKYVKWDFMYNFLQTKLFT